MAVPPPELGYALRRWKVPWLPAAPNFRDFLVLAERFLQVFSGDVGGRRFGVGRDHGLIFPGRQIALLLQIVRLTRTQIRLLQGLRVGLLGLRNQFVSSGRTREVFLRAQ